MDEGQEVRELLTWFLGTNDEEELRRGLAAIEPHVWPGFSAEAAAELATQDEASRQLHRHVLGEERHRREYGRHQREG